MTKRRVDESLVRWLSEPREDRGIAFFENGLWRTQTYAELASMSWRAAAGLRDRGVESGSHVVIALPSGSAFIATFFGTWMCGATPTPVAPSTAVIAQGGYEDHLRSVLTAVDAQALVVNDEYGEPLRSLGLPVSRVVRADALLASDGEVRVVVPELAILQLTSGATGPPKAVRIEMPGLVANIEAIRDWLGWSSGDIGSTWLPMHHDMGLIGVLSAVTSMTDSQIMRPEDFIRRPLEWLQCHGARGATRSGCPPFGLEHVVRRVKPDRLEGLDFSTWESLAVGAERVAPQVLARFARLLEPFGFRMEALCPAYGMAETTVACTGSRPGARPKLAVPSGEVRDLTVADVEAPGDAVVSCGTPVRGMEVRVVDEDGRPLAERAVGTIVARGTSLASGYGAPDSPEKVDFGGEYLTGDLGFLLAGELFVLGRAGDSLRLHGKSIFAEQVEAEVARVAEVPSRRFCVLLGQAYGPPMAILIVERRLRDEVESEVRRTVSRATGGLAHVEVVGPRPVDRTTSGKPRRAVMWRAYLRGDLRESPSTER